MKITQIGTGESGQDLDFRAYKIHKIKFLEETEDAVFLRNYPQPTEFSIEGFIFPEEVDQYTVLDNFRTWIFGVEHDEAQDVPEAFAELGEGGLFPEGLELDFTEQPEEQIPTNFQNCDIEVECTPKWEINANTLRIHLPYADTQDAFSLTLMWKLDSHFIIYDDANDENVNTWIEEGDYNNLSGFVYSTSYYNTDWAVDNAGGVTFNIRGDLSRLLGIKIACNDGFHITGLQNCTNLELLDIYNNYDQGMYDYSRPFWDERTIDIIPASVKYLYLDLVRVTDCLAHNPTYFYVNGHSEVFTSDPINFLGEGTKVFRYYPFNGLDENNYSVYAEPKLKIQKWQTKDLRWLHISGVTSKESMENLVKSMQMYLEPNPHPFSGGFRYIVVDQTPNSPAVEYLAANDNEVSNWLADLTFYKPDYYWGEY